MPSDYPFGIFKDQYFFLKLIVFVQVNFRYKLLSNCLFLKTKVNKD